MTLPKKLNGSQELQWSFGAGPPEKNPPDDCDWGKKARDHGGAKRCVLLSSSTSTPRQAIRRTLFLLSGSLDVVSQPIPSHPNVHLARRRCTTASWLFEFHGLQPTLLDQRPVSRGIRESISFASPVPASNNRSVSYCLHIHCAHMSASTPCTQYHIILDRCCGDCPAFINILIYLPVHSHHRGNSRQVLSI